MTTTTETTTCGTCEDGIVFVTTTVDGSTFEVEEPCTCERGQEVQSQWEDDAFTAWDRTQV